MLKSVLHLYSIYMVYTETDIHNQVHNTPAITDTALSTYMILHVYVHLQIILFVNIGTLEKNSPGYKQ